MSSKTLQSFAIIESLWRAGGKDLIEIHAILSVKILDKLVAEGHNTIDAKELAECFRTELGLSNLTIGAAYKILRRLDKTHNVVRKSDHRFVIQSDKLCQFREAHPYESDLTEEIDKIVEEIRERAKDKFKLEYTSEQITEGLISFFDSFGGDVVIEQKEIKDLSVMRYRKKTSAQQLKYIISGYVLEKEEAKAPELDFLVQFAIGNMVANAVSMQDFTEFNEGLKDLIVYLDAPIIFNLLKLSGEMPYELAKDLLDRLKRLKCKIVVGFVHRQEITGAINHARNLLLAENPDKTKVNRIYIECKAQGLTPRDLDIILNSLDSKLEANGITVISHPPKESGYCPVTEKEINATIMRAYSEKIRRKPADGKETEEDKRVAEKDRKLLTKLRKESIARDAKVIRQVLQCRADSTGMRLNDAGALLVTNNLKLCNIISKKMADRETSRFPPVILAENLSTIIWATNPENNSMLQKKRLISECIASLRVKADLLRRFYNDIKQKHAAHSISDRDYHNLVTSEMVGEWLSEATFNSRDWYTDEIEQDIIRRQQAMAELEAREKAAEAQQATSEAQRSLENVDETLVHDSLRSAGVIAGVIGILLLALFVCSALGLFKGRAIWMTAVTLLLGTWAVWNWLGIIPTHKRLHTMICYRIYRRKYLKYMRKPFPADGRVDAFDNSSPCPFTRRRRRPRL